MFKRFIFAALLAPMLAMGDVLRWQVNDTATVDGIGIQTFLSPYLEAEDDDHWAAARVKVTDGNGTILDIWYDNPDDPPARWDSGYWGTWIGDTGGGYWGTDGVQSRTGHKTWYSTTDNQSEIVLENPEVIEALFQIELGFNSWNEDVGDYVWETLAESLPKETYKALREQYMYEPGTIDPRYPYYWTPTEFYTHPPVPEPSSFLLSLVGCSFLLLRRKESHGQI